MGDFRVRQLMAFSKVCIRIISIVSRSFLKIIAVNLAIVLVANGGQSESLNVLDNPLLVICHFNFIILRLIFTFSGQVAKVKFTTE